MCLERMVPQRKIETVNIPIRFFKCIGCDRRIPPGKDNEEIIIKKS